MKFLASSLMAALLCTPAFADSHEEVVGDAAAGEKVFNQCQGCHMVVNEAGETLAGRSGRTGPNLYGVAGRTAGTVEDYRYSDSLVEAGEQGLEWDAEHFVAYVMDPSGHLTEFLGENARSKMSFKLRKEEDAQNVYAYLASLAPEEEGEEGAAEEGAAEEGEAEGGAAN